MSAYHHGSLRAALLAAAESSLRLNSADQLSVRELAREIGVSHAAPRRHFPDRQALLDALAESGFVRLHAELGTALAAAGDDFTPGLRAVAGAYLRFAAENAALLELMFTHKRRKDVAGFAVGGLMRLMHDLIVRGQAQGFLEAGDPQYLGMALFATLQGIAALINGDLVPQELIDGMVTTAVDHLVLGSGPGAVV